jgi:hypothetical protein
MDNLLPKPTGDSDLYWDVEVTPEDEDKIIRKIAEKIHQYGLDIPAVQSQEIGGKKSQDGRRRGTREEGLETVPPILG